MVVPDPTILRNATPDTLDRSLRGRRFEEPERIGKWLICWTDGPALLLHFGMTGDLIWAHDAEDRHRWDRLILVFDDGELRYRNMRKLGGVWLAHGRDEVTALLGGLGPDALSLTSRAFDRVLARRNGGVKAALMDQAVLAGVGNLVADEVLWQARIHPRTRIEDTDEEQRAGLYRTMHAVLKESVDRYDYVSRKRSWLSHVRGRPGAACPRCGTPLERITAAGRTTWYCPACQPLLPDAPAPATRPTRAAGRSRPRAR